MGLLSEKNKEGGALHRVRRHADIAGLVLAGDGVRGGDRKSVV